MKPGHCIGDDFLNNSQSLFLRTSIALYNYLVRYHWDGEKIIGPDPGIRWNFRFWRYVKNGLSFISWKDHVYFLQCQGYWIMNSWRLFELTENPVIRDRAIACTDYVLRTQEAGGFWRHPLPEWRDRIATVEGIYASLGLMATYERTKNTDYMAAAMKWFEYLNNTIGFQKAGDGLAVNYFAHIHGGAVPNNSTLLLTFLGELFRITKDQSILESCLPLIRFLRHAQRENGEMPYIYANPHGKTRDHLLCYQYNAFEFLDLVRYYEIVQDESVMPILKKCYTFLETGVNTNGSAMYNCHHTVPEIHYYTAVLGAALFKATQLEINDCVSNYSKIYLRLLAFQNKEGGFPFSRRSYGLLKDSRSYPRYQAMILKHLLIRASD
jgi:hypothetical protein